MQGVRGVWVWAGRSRAGWCLEQSHNRWGRQLVRVAAPPAHMGLLRLMMAGGAVQQLLLLGYAAAHKHEGRCEIHTVHALGLMCGLQAAVP